MINPCLYIRHELHITQAMLAKAVGVSQPLISLYEYWLKHPSPTIAKKIINFAADHGLKVKMEDFYIK
jgi:DNA-binding XRE family transcriptional regulator